MMANSNFISFELKNFIKSSNETNFEAISTKNKFVDKLKFDGNEAKIAYETIINEFNGQSTKKQSKNAKKLKSNSSEHKKVFQKQLHAQIVNNNNYNNKKSNTININHVFKSIEQGNLEFLQKHLSHENVNTVDSFGWTPLMSASLCGNEKIVEFLLQLGADKNCKDKSGYNALQLAQRKNHVVVINILQRKKALKSSEIKSKKVDEHVDDSNTEEFYCSSCKTTFKDTTVKKHNTSTLHIFNTTEKLAPNTVYGIPKSNRGYQIMINTGWNDQNGLGPSGSGLKYPLKTVLKNDRKGLGNNIKNNAQVTHVIDSNNINKDRKKSSIGEIYRAVRKKDHEKILKRQRKKEIAIRRALS